MRGKQEKPTMYKTTIRFYTPEDINLVLGLKKEFGYSSLSKAIRMLIIRYRELKERDEKLRRAVKTRYEIDSKTLDDVFDIGY